MAKSKEELDAIKSEFDALKEKLRELTSEELEEAAGGYKYLGHSKYSLNKGDCFRERGAIYKVKYDYPELDYDILSPVICDKYQEPSPGRIFFSEADWMLNIRALDNMEYLGVDFV